MRPQALALILLALSFLTAASAQPVTLPRATAPLALVDFSDASLPARWSGLPCRPAQADGAAALQFTLPKWQPGGNEWPAVYLRYDDGRGFTAQDWSHYAILALDAWTSGDAPGDVAVELRDEEGRNGYAEHHDLAPGKANHIEIPLAGLRTEAKLEHIREIVFFATHPAHEYTVTVANLRLLPGERPPLADIRLQYPNYRGLVFPNVDRVKASVSLQVAEYGIRSEDLSVRVTCTGGGEEVTATRPTRRGRAVVSVSTASLPSGPLHLTATVCDPTGATLASRDFPLHKLTRAEAAGLKVYVDEHNNTIVDGKPFFPLGWYDNVSESHSQEIADSPYNCVLDYGTDFTSKAQMRQYLDMLQRKHLKMIYCLNDVYPTATYFDGKSWEGIKGNQPIADAAVRAYRDHPAMLAWYLNDELPRGLAPQPQAYYRRIAQLDPNHPCYIVLCNMAELSYFTDTTDVMGVDPYPIPTSPVTVVRDWMEAANRATHRDMPTWLVPQAFAWYQHNPEGSDRSRIPTAEELRTGRAPTYEEARCMTYLALAHGAKGLVYWCYYNMRVLPQYAEMWGWMKKIGAEVQALSPVLLSPDVLGRVRCEPSTAPIHTRLIRHDGKLTLIAVNAGRSACDVTFDLPAAASPVRALKALPATFAPLEARVLVIDG